MNSEVIKEGIARWSNNRGDSTTINGYLAQGDEFVYDFPSYAADSEFLHAYPGVVDDILYFFLIPSEYDKEEYSDDIDQYAIPCLVVKNVSGGHEIPSKEAEARMRAWKNNYEAWVPAQISNTTYGLFQAFAISTDDFENRNEPIIISLGLKQSAYAEVDFDADLVIINQADKQLIYDDFVRSVPPFGTSAMSQNEFYLLPVSI